MRLRRTRVATLLQGCLILSGLVAFSVCCRSLVAITVSCGRGSGRSGPAAGVAAGSLGVAARLSFRPVREDVLYLLRTPIPVA